MTEAEYEQLGLYYFASVDLVGSTSFKSAGNNQRKSDNPEEHHNWLDDFTIFYRELPREFEYNARNLSCQSIPKVWKTNGDEILFCAQISEIKDIQILCESLESACKTYRAGCLSDKLGLKLCSWLGGTPVINKRLCDNISHHVLANLINTCIDKSDIRERASEVFAKLESKVEFIGPSIDAGFRLAHYASRNMHILSVELALVLAELSLEINPDVLGIYYISDKSLKGVLGERDYPLFFKIVDDPLFTSRLELQGHTFKKPQRIREFCMEFINDVNDPFLIVRPYIKDSKDENWNKVPDNHEKFWKGIQDSMNKRYAIEKKEEDAGENLPPELSDLKIK